VHLAPPKSKKAISPADPCREFVPLERPQRRHKAEPHSGTLSELRFVNSQIVA